MSMDRINCTIACLPSLGVAMIIALACPLAASGQQAAAPSMAAVSPAARHCGCGAAAESCGIDASSPAAPCLGNCQSCMQGVDCRWADGAEGRWSDLQPIDFQPLAQGEYAGPARLAHLAQYRLRPNDQLQMVYLITRRQTVGAYRLAVGDEVLIESGSDPELQRGTLENGLVIQPDGTITVRMLGQVHAAGLTVPQLRELLDKQYEKFVVEPAIDVTPVKTNTLAEDIRNAVGGQSGFSQQVLTVQVTPDGKVRLPGVGAVCVQGLTLEELKREINLQYEQIVVGLEVEPILAQQAPHYVYVLGEVAVPNRFQMDAPTTVLGAISLAGGYLPGGNMRQVVVFRRAEDWRMITTMLDLRGAVLAKRPTPADEIWLRDGDVVIVPKSPIRVFNHFVQQVFTEGIYGVVPFNGISINVGDGNNF